jgi:hypothetical protein
MYKKGVYAKTMNQNWSKFKGEKNVLSKNMKNIA